MTSKQGPADSNHKIKAANHTNAKASPEPLHKAASVDNVGWSAEPKQASAREGWMEKIKSRDAVRTVSANELTSLSALIAYAAYKTGASEFRIERDLADRFNIANVKCLPAARFDDAMRYLVDQVPTQSA